MVPSGCRYTLTLCISKRNAIEEKKSCNQKKHRKNILPIKKEGVEGGGGGGDKTNLNQNIQYLVQVLRRCGVIILRSQVEEYT